MQRADDGIRTRDLRFTKPLLYQLSYVGAERQTLHSAAPDTSAVQSPTLRCLNARAARLTETRLQILWQNKCLSDLTQRNPLRVTAQRGLKAFDGFA